MMATLNLVLPLGAEWIWEFGSLGVWNPFSYKVKFV
jgi:hypothetical protein